MSLEQEERTRELVSRTQPKFEQLRTDFHTVLEDLVQLLYTRHEVIYDVTGSTSADLMVRGLAHGHKVHVRVDIEEVLT